MRTASGSRRTLSSRGYSRREPWAQRPDRAPARLQLSIFTLEINNTITSFAAAHVYKLCVRNRETERPMERPPYP